MKRIGTLILLLILIIQNVTPQTGCISGFIYSKKDSSGIVGANIIMNEVNTTIISDNSGYFEVCDLKPRKYSFGIAIIGYKDTSINKVQVISDLSNHLTIYLSECGYDLPEKSNVCPICGKSDMVIPILYEVATNKMLKRSKQGTVYLGGHRTGCDATFYCKRDSIKY
jgi:hypothetical protein